MSEAKSAALRLVLTKRRTEKEVREALIKKGFSASEAAEAASYYRENGYIDHADFAKRFAHDAARLKGFGPCRIARELSMRGIDETDIEAALSSISFDVQTHMSLRFGTGVRDKKEHIKIYQYYLRKGFASEAIRTAMDALYTYE